MARFASCGAALPPKLELKFGEGGHDRCYRAAGRGGGVYSFAQGAQQDSALTEFGDGAGDFGDQAAKAVDGGDHDDVVGAGLVQHRGQPRAGGVGRPGERVSQKRLAVTPAAVSVESCASRSWLVVLTRAWPRIAVIAMTVSLLPDSKVSRHAVWDKERDTTTCG
ncbi:hypothetical protein MUNTM_38430 [Mycobacterium sp. MUNTM1]